MVKNPAFFISLVFLSTTIVPQVAFAQATTSATANESYRQKIQQEREQLKQNHMEFRASRSADRQSFVQTIQQTRQDAQAKFMADRQAFQQKLQSIRDERKHQLVSQIQNKMTMINTNRTTIMSQKLEKLSTILANIQTKAETAKANGKNTTSVDASIINAQNAITAAETALQAQAAKQYVITLTATEGAALKMDVSTTAKEFQTDMQSVHALMVAAKQAVVDAAQALAIITGMPRTNTSTDSAVQTTQ